MSVKNSIEITNPEIAKEWHPTKNGSLKPKDVTKGSGKKVWWLMPYDDPKTGKHWDFEWKARIADRCGRDRGCPQLRGQKVEVGFNDLGTLFPEIASEWDYQSNQGLTPFDVPFGTGKKAHWVYHYDDPRTGKHWDFRWEATINSRTNLGRGCPQLSNQKVEVGFNDLATTNPETARLWDYELNNGITPQDVTAGSTKKYHWIYPYDDPKTGKHWDFRYEASCSDAVHAKTCPQLAGKIVEKGFNDFATTNPDVAKLWDYELNNGITPEEVSKGSKKSYHWVYPYDDPKTGKHWDFKYTAKCADAAKYSSCPQLAGKKIEVGFNDLATVAPEIAAQWDYDLNGKLTPFDVMAYSNKSYHWIYPYDDPKTGKHWDFKWAEKISNRVNFPLCPFLINRRLWVGYNDFETLYPELAKEWHPTKNGDLKPSDICGAPYKKVWWLYIYHNPVNGKKYKYSWKAAIVNRARGARCPYLPEFESYGETFVRQYLQNNQLQYELQKSFPGLLGVKGRPLSYDFCMEYKGLRFLIEYQGIQHYEPVDFEGTGDDDANARFLIQKEHDRRKKQYAKKNGFVYIEVKYTVSTYEEVADYLSKKIESFVNKRGS